VILAGFLLPTLAVESGGVHVVFGNFQILGEKGAPGILKFHGLYPGLAGVAVIVLARAARGAGRSLTLAALGVVPVVVVAVSGDVREAAMSLATEAMGFAVVVSLVFWLVAFTGLYAASRARFFRPASRAAAIIGALSGGVCLVHLVVPVLPSGIGKIELMVPFKLMAHEEVVWLGAARLGSMGCMIAASVICIMNARRRPGAQRLAQQAVRLIWIAIAVVVGGWFVTGLVSALASGQGGQLVGDVTRVLKMFCWMLGLVLLLPVGIADLIVNLTPLDRPAAPAAGAPRD